MSLEAFGLGVASKAVDYGIGRLVQKQNVDDAKHLAQYNDALQRRLLQDSPALQKAGLQKAGLSVAALNGSFQSVSDSSQASTPKMDAPQGVDFLTASNLVAQNRLIHAQAEAQELANRKEEDVQNAFYSRGESVNEYIDARTGNVLSQSDYDKLPDKVKNEQGRFELQKVSPARYSQEGYAVKEVLARVSSETVRHNLERTITNLKLEDADVKAALSKMDKATFDKLVAESKLLLANENVQKQVYDLAKKTQAANVSKAELERDLMKLGYEIQQFNFEADKKTDISKAWQSMSENFSFGSFMTFIGSILVSVLKSASSDVSGVLKVLK